MLSKPYSNVVAAFNRGISAKTNPPGAPTTVVHGAQDDMLVPSKALLVLADSPQYTLTFSDFSRYLPGDTVGSMSSALQLMNRGWVEFVGDISETSAIRLTPSGRELADTLRKSFGR